MKKAALILLLLSPLLLFAGGNPGNPTREFTVADSVRWTLSNLGFAINEGLTEEALLQFSSSYSDMNGINFTSLGTILTQILSSEEFSAGSNNFLMYNASAQVVGNQAFLSVTIVLDLLNSAEISNSMVIKDTITLERTGGFWFITSAPNLVAGFAGAAGFSLPSRQEPQPNQASYDEYFSTFDFPALIKEGVVDD